jgi:hypothetical protein
LVPTLNSFINPLYMSGRICFILMTALLCTVECTAINIIYAVPKPVEKYSVNLFRVIEMFGNVERILKMLEFYRISSKQIVNMLQSVAICCNLLQSVAICCNLLQSVAICCKCCILLQSTSCFSNSLYKIYAPSHHQQLATVYAEKFGLQPLPSADNRLIFKVFIEIVRPSPGAATGNRQLF